MAALAVDPAVRGGGLDHGVLARDVVRRDGHVDRVAHPAYDVEVAERGLHHHDVGALVDVEQRLADALAGVGGVLLVGPPVALRARSRRPRGTGRRRPRRTSRSRPGSRRRCAPAPSRAPRIAATWPSIIPLGPTMSTPASAWASAISAYTSRVASLSTRPSGVSTPQCPWSVNSSRQRSLITVSASPTSATTSVIATLRIPDGSVAPDPSASLCSRDAEQHHAAEPEVGRLVRQPSAGSRGCAGRRRACVEIGRGSVGALADEHRQHELLGRQPGLGDQAPQTLGRAEPPWPGDRPRDLGPPGTSLMGRDRR